MIYKAEIDITKILPLLKRLGIFKYVRGKTYVFIKAEDPDEACALSIEQIGQEMITINDTTAVRDLVMNLSFSIRVTKITRIGPQANGGF